MTNGFNKYLAESVKEYGYKIKLAVDDVDDNMIDSIMYSLNKYQMVSATPFKRTPIQENPLDFPNIKNSAVCISDIVLSYPASIDFMETMLANVLGLSRQCVVVYSDHDPRIAETELYLERNSDEFKDGYEPALGSDPQGEEVESHADQSMSLLKTLGEMESAQTTHESDLVPSDLASDDVLPNDYGKFNDSLPDESVSLFGRVQLPPKGQGIK